MRRPSSRWSASGPLRCERPSKPKTRARAARLKTQHSHTRVCAHFLHVSVSPRLMAMKTPRERFSVSFKHSSQHTIQRLCKKRRSRRRTRWRRAPRARCPRASRGGATHRPVAVYRCAGFRFDSYLGVVSSPTRTIECVVRLPQDTRESFRAMDLLRNSFNSLSKHSVSGIPNSIGWGGRRDALRGAERAGAAERGHAASLLTLFQKHVLSPRERVSRACL